MGASIDPFHCVRNTAETGSQVSSSVPETFYSATSLPHWSDSFMHMTGWLKQSNLHARKRKLLWSSNQRLKAIRHCCYCFVSCVVIATHSLIHSRHDIMAWVLGTEGKVKNATDRFHSPFLIKMWFSPVTEQQHKAFLFCFLNLRGLIVLWLGSQTAVFCVEIHSDVPLDVVFCRVLLRRFTRKLIKFGSAFRMFVVFMKPIAILISIKLQSYWQNTRLDYFQHHWNWGEHKDDDFMEPNTTLFSNWTKACVTMGLCERSWTVNTHANASLEALVCVNYAV